MGKITQVVVYLLFVLGPNSHILYFPNILLSHRSKLRRNKSSDTLPLLIFNDVYYVESILLAEEKSSHCDAIFPTLRTVVCLEKVL